ncbi:MAG: DUF2723 domain-containing protein [bacterium]
MRSMLRSDFGERLACAGRRVAAVPSAGVQAAGVGLLLLLVYGLTAARHVTLEDDGIFIMAAYTLGMAHPPGYPLHTALGWLFTHLPLATVEWRVHFLSGVFGAMTCSMVWLLVRRLTGTSIGAWAAALGLGLSGVFWSQAIIAEVYTLNTFLFASAWLAVVAYGDTGSRRHLELAALACGLGLANHWPLFLLSAPGLLLIALPRWRQMPRQAVSALPVFLVAAVLPYLWLYVRSRMHPAFSFLGPLENWDDLWGMIQRRMYELSDSVSASGRDRLALAGFFGRELCVQFTPAGWACWAWPSRLHAKSRKTSCAGWTSWSSLSVPGCLSMPAERGCLAGTGGDPLSGISGCTAPAVLSGAVRRAAWMGASALHLPSR